jgi:hypothetical protein
MMENSAFHLYESVLNRVFMRFETLLELKTAVGADLPCETGLASPSLPVLYNLRSRLHLFLQACSIPVGLS